MSSPLVYQAAIYVAGQMFHCVESYESLFERLRDTAFKMDEEQTQTTWLPPIEVTIKGSDGPLRALFSPAAISGVIELPEQDRTEVAE